MEVILINTHNYNQPELEKGVKNINSAIQLITKFCSLLLGNRESSSPANKEQIITYVSKMTAIVNLKTTMLSSIKKTRQDIIDLRVQIQAEITTKRDGIKKLMGDKDFYITEKSNCMTDKARSINDITPALIKKAKVLIKQKKNPSLIMMDVFKIFFQLLKGTSQLQDADIMNELKQPKVLINFITKFELITIDKGLEQDIDAKTKEIRKKISTSDLEKDIEQNKSTFIPFLIYSENTLLIYGNKKKILAKEKEIDTLTMEAEQKELELKLKSTKDEDEEIVALEKELGIYNEIIVLLGKIKITKAYSTKLPSMQKDIQILSQDKSSLYKHN